MSESILNGKKILVVDDEPDVLEVVEGEITDACPKCTIDRATTYDAAVKMLETRPYDIVILDIMGVRGFDLLELAVKKDLRVVMLTAHALNPEALQKAIVMKARAYLPKEKLGELVPFLEDVLKYDYESGWKRLFHGLYDVFTANFESDWEKKMGAPWREWIPKPRR